MTEGQGVVLDMARPKKRKPAPGRPKVHEPKRPIASFRGTERFKEWFDGLALHVRLPASVLIVHALIDYARKQGYEVPVPER